MKRLLRTATFSLVLLLVSSANAEVTYEALENNTLRKCEDHAEDFFNQEIDSSEFYYCALSQLISMKRVFGYYTTEENRNHIHDLITLHWDQAYSTADWVKVWKDLQEYLEEIPHIPAE